MDTPTGTLAATETRPRLPQAHPLLLVRDGKPSDTDILILSTCVIVIESDKLTGLDDCLYNPL